MQSYRYAVLTYEISHQILLIVPYSYSLSRICSNRWSVHHQQKIHMLAIVLQTCIDICTILTCWACCACWRPSLSDPPSLVMCRALVMCCAPTRLCCRSRLGLDPRPGVTKQSWSTRVILSSYAFLWEIFPPLEAIPRLPSRGNAATCLPKKSNAVQGHPK